MNKNKSFKRDISAVGAACAMLFALSACNSSSDSTPAPVAPAQPTTPTSLSLSKIGAAQTNVFEQSAAEIPAFDPASQRLFVTNASTGAIDVFNLANPANPVKVGELATTSVLAGSTVNSVAVANGLVAVAVEAPVKTDPGRMALYRASDLSLVSFVTVGAQPDMVVFTPDGRTVLTANEGEPSDDYQVDPVGSISVIDISTPANPQVRTAGFTQFNGQEAALRAQGIRIYGPNASAAQDFEPEYIAVSEDSATAFVSLQENNAIAVVDIASASVSRIFPLGLKDHGVAGNELDVSDRDNAINIRTWPGVVGMYLPDAIATYTVNGVRYIVTANEGDARAWGEDNPAYFAGDANQGFVEEFRVNNLVNPSGWAGRVGDDLPPQLNALAAGGLLNPTVFGYCGASAGSPGGCRSNDALSRLNISWVQGYRTDANGAPVMFNSMGQPDPAGDRLMYDQLFAYGARSFSIFTETGDLVFDSGSQFETFLASDECMAGSQRNIPCKNFFNTGHNEGDALDSRSDAKGPEPEGIVLGKIGNKTFAFIGLERMGGVFVYDITNPTAPQRIDYLNTRDNFVLTPDGSNLAQVGDLGPEGLAFISAEDSPNGKPLLVVTNEVSGSTAVLELNLQF